MNSIVLHDAFVAQGCARKQAPQPAVTVGAGAIWMHVYDTVTTQAGRYVQEGGCATVGVAGLIQSGGFGSFSKNYGLAAAGLLEAEVVTADGALRIAKVCTNPDLFGTLRRANPFRAGQHRQDWDGVPGDEPTAGGGRVATLPGVGGR